MGTEPRCNACGRPLDLANAADDGQAVCGCGYINLVSIAERSFPLADALRACLPGEAIPEILHDDNDPEVVRAMVETAMHCCLRRVNDLVADAPALAAAAVWPGLLEFESASRAYRRGNTGMGTRMVWVDRAIQVLVACLYEQGMTQLAPAAVEPDELSGFMGEFSEVAMTAAGLGNLLADLEWGLAEGALREGTLHSRQTQRNRQLLEWQVNRNALWQRTRGSVRGEDVFSDASARAQEIFLGCSPVEGRPLFADGHALLRELAVYHEATVYAIPQAACPEPVRCLFDHLAFTPERLERFAVPFYWDLGTAVRGDEDPEHAVRKVALCSWFNYYPLIPVRLATGEPGYFVSAESLTYALGNLESYKGRLLQRIHDRLKEMGEPAEARRAAVGRLRKEANTRLEDIAAEVGRKLGFEAATGIYLLDGGALPGGEIDVLLAAQQGDDLLIVLAEVKDFDMTLHRMHGEETLRGKVREAEKQLARKAADLRQHWRRLLETVSEGRLKPAKGETVLVQALLTADLLPSFVSSDYPAVALEGMGEFVEMLQRGAEAFPPRFAATARERLA